MAELEVIIGGDSKPLDKEIKKVEKELKRLEAQKQTNVKLGVDTSGLDKSISTTQTKLNGLKTSLNSAATATKTFDKAAGNGGNTLMQFSRIAQDAPFGIMGIGNNITATAESFSYLSKSSGGAGNALKAVASSMMGTGGILLAVSLVTSALTYMSQNGITVGDVFNKLAGNFDGYADSLKKAKEAAYGDDGVKNAITNVSSLTNEIDLAKKGFISKTGVVEHYNETIGKTTGLVSSIDEAEKALVRNGDAYIKMMLYKAVATNAMEAASLQLLEVEKTKDKKLKEFANSFQDANVSQIRSKTQYDAVEKELVNRQIKRKNEEIKINKDAADKNIAIAKKFNDQAAKISKDLNFNFFQDTKAPKASKAPKAEKPEKSKGFDFGGGFMGGGIVSPTLALDSALLQMDITRDLAREKLAEHFAMMTELGIQFSENFNKLVADSMASGLGDFGTAIGDALASGGNVLKAAGNSILQTMGKFLSDLGGQLIQYGTLAVIKGKLDLAILSGGPVAIGAGLAAIAVGVALKAAGALIGKTASGGGSSGGGSTSGRDYSSPTSSSSGGGGGFSSGSVVFEISGNSLIGVLSNTLDKNSRLGGNLGI